MLWQNCIPVFTDIDPETYRRDPRCREKTDRTAAVITIHLFGQCSHMYPLVKIRREHGLYLIEDASQAHLAEYKSRLAATIGDLGCFSLQQPNYNTSFPFDFLIKFSTSFASLSNSSFV
ncbi:MAG: DegT/DnrJ/EryC1/StrS family aminotransferase [Thermoproteota archaeon]